MLFNSYEFILLFLPITLIGFRIMKRYFTPAMACYWLVLASLFFYGWWSPIYLVVVILSIVSNYFLGGLIHKRASRWFLTLGIGLNLGALAYFKYANFFVENLNWALGTQYHLAEIVLPLAISFFTFQQIAYLVDVYQGAGPQEYNFPNYALFVLFFPQLIAGPIVHHKEMLPQFKEDRDPYIWSDLAIGLTIFGIGLFKKVVLADTASLYVGPMFDQAAVGAPVQFFQAWGGVLAYTMQLYFDFSGYSDMAIGAARLFGIKLPLNFFSPYKATSIIEFWRRWHITLSRFLRDYLYIALGGNRKGLHRRYANLLLTMVLGGFWHGANWTFIVWGMLHGAYLIINHTWRNLKGHLGFSLGARTNKALAWGLTFLAVVVGWVFFRAADVNTALRILSGMSGLHGVSIPNILAVQLGRDFQQTLQTFGITFYLGGGKTFLAMYLWIAILFIIALLLPNTYQLMKKHEPTVSTFHHKPQDAIHLVQGLEALQFSFQRVWAIVGALLFVAGMLGLTQVSEFLYFQF